jgi:hypothetical protein
MLFLKLIKSEHIILVSLAYYAESDVSGLNWKWVAVKHSGAHISPRCGMSLAMAPGNKAYAFGGVWDVEEGEEDLAGTFYNDLFILDLDRTLWRTGNCSIQ